MNGSVSMASNVATVLVRVVINTIGLGFAAILFRHVFIDSFAALCIAGAVLSICNMIVKPILVFLSIPFLIISLGLFYIVISGLVIMLTSWIVSGFFVDGFWAAIGVSIVVGAVNLLFDLLYTKNGHDKNKSSF